MKTPHLKLAALCFCFLALRAAATTYYADINCPSPTPPYTSWTTAATNIQDAISETVNGDLILVNPGVYQSGGYTAPDGALTAVDVTNVVTLQSANGASATFINGSNAMRCVYLANGATLTGFTLANGKVGNAGGGVYCASIAGTVISNCVIISNFAINEGGGAFQGTLINSVVSQNFANQYGGGAYDAVLLDCIIISNSVYGGQGAGVYNSDVTNSLIANNFQLLLNSPNSEGGGAYGGNLDHCNITGNSAETGGGTYNANMVNCINYFNTCGANSSGTSNYVSFSSTINYTCTAPNPFSSGIKNIASDPQLASLSHISLGSPCRGAGSATNSSGVDIDGNPWANPPSMGCFEPYPGSVLGNVTVSISTPYTNWAPNFSLNLQANISGPVYSNVWNFGDGTFVTNQAYVSHTWTVPGIYPVTLTAYNDTYYPTGVTATLPINVTVPSVYYVNLDNFNPVPPYITPATAAMNIQDAVNVATAGSVVLVTNGPTLPGLNPYFVTNTAAFYMGGGTNAPDGNFYRVVITNAITVESVNGPATTYIFGGTTPSYAKCIYLTNGATLIGFTLTNWNNSPGQISAAPTNTIISNCVVTADMVVNFGTLETCLITGASYCNNSSLTNCSLVRSGGSASCAFNNCIISNNSYVNGGVLNNCILVDNTNSGNFGAANAGIGYPLVLNNCLISNNVSQAGSGVYNYFTGTPTYYTNCVLNNCTLIRNSAQRYGGGAWGAELNNCLVSSNTDGFSEGAGVEGGLLVNCILIGNSNGAVDGSNILPSGAILTNCTLIGNVGVLIADECTLDQCTISQNAGVGAARSTLNQCTLMQNGGGASASALNNCLIISNVATMGSIGAPAGAGANGCTLTNCILAYNVATNGGGAYRSTLVNCTVIANSGVNGGGINDCIADNCIVYRNTGGDYYPSTSQYPLNYCCVSTPATYGIRDITNVPIFLAPGNFHLQSTSPCINSGNNAYISSATDLDGNARIVGGTVDIGAYEYQTPSSVISYAYLQQYGLPTDGSVDFKDLDGTAFNVYQDWIAGLNPTNPASVLAMLTPVTTNTAAGVTVTWQSVSGISYFLQRSTNLISQAPFTTIQSNITGQTNTTSYTDTTATGNVPYFYRVGVVAP